MIECIRGEDLWHTYMYSMNGAPLVYAKWRKQGDAAEAHNEMYQHTKSALLESRRLLTEEVMQDMAHAGCKYLVVTDLNCNVDAARVKYWKFMGFKVAGSIHGITFAVMEITCQQSQ